MRFNDVCRLATTNLRQNKRRSVTVVVTMAVIFGLVMGVGFFARGTWNLLFKTSLGQAEQTYLSLGYTVRGGRGGEKVDSLDDVLANLETLVQQYGGKVVGTIKTYDQDGRGQVRVIDSGLAKALAIEPLQEIPKGKIGVLVAQDWAGMEELSGQFIKVGEFRRPARNDLLVQGFAPSNMLVGGIWSFGTPEYYLLAGAAAKAYAESEQAKSFEKAQEYLETSPIANESDWKDLIYKKAPMVEIVVEFADYRQALELVDDTGNTDFKDVPKTVNYNGVSYGLLVDDFFGHYTTSIVRQMDYNTEVILMPVVLALTVVALLVALSTFAHLVESDVTTILLYRARGASLGQVYIIYLIYLLELCLLAIGLSIIIGLVLALGMSLMSTLAGFGAAVQEFFGLVKSPFWLLVGVDAIFWRSVGLMLLIAPITLLMTSWRFSSKHVAKKLKEEM